MSAGKASLHQPRLHADARASMARASNECKLIFFNPNHKHKGQHSESLVERKATTVSLRAS